MRTARWVAILVVLSALPAPQAVASPATAAQAGAAYLATQQYANGTWNIYNIALIAEAASALELDPHAWPSADNPLAPALRIPSGLGADATYKMTERIANAASALGIDPRSVRDASGTDAITLIQAGFKGAQFGDPTTINDDVWAILSLRAAGIAPDDPTLRAAAVAIMAARGADGGWSFASTPGTSDTDMTGMALAALADVGQLPSDARAASFLETQYDAATGGYKTPPPKGATTSAVNVQSTVWALRGRALLGEAPRPESLAYLASVQNAQGAFPGGGTPSNPFATAEAVTYLAGGRFPGSSFANGSVRIATAPASETTRFHLDGPFQRATWSFDEGVTNGIDAAFAFTEPGLHRYSVVARGDGVAFTTNGTMFIDPARPLLLVSPVLQQALRGAPVLVVAFATAATGQHISSYQWDWGDGNTTQGAASSASHVYVSPGTFVVRVVAVDDRGATSDAAQSVVRALDRAPQFAPLPSRILANRTADVVLPVTATDPDDDGINITWTSENASGSGAPRVRFAALGNYTLSLVATDAFGESAYANVTIEVVNLPPILGDIVAEAGHPSHFAITALDPDGPAPQISWGIGNETRQGASVDADLSPGTYELEVVATDLDGAQARATRSLQVPEAHAASNASPLDAPASPAVTSLDATLEAGVLRIRGAVSPGASAFASWTSDAGNGTAALVEGLAEAALPDATRASVTLVARAGNLSASRTLEVRAHAPPPLEEPGIIVSTARTNVGESVTLLATLPPGATEARLDLGDGNLTAWSAVTRLAHAWSAPGTYAVRVFARADDGRVSESGTNITIASSVSRVTSAEPLQRAEAPITPAIPSADPPQRTVPAPPASLALAGVLLSVLVARARKARR